MFFLHPQATFLLSNNEENFLWKNLLIAVVAVCLISNNLDKALLDKDKVGFEQLYV